MIGISHKTGILEGTVELPTSKSIANRVLVLQHILGQKSELIPDNNDILLMQHALLAIKNNETIDAEDAGTVLRFALATAAATAGYKGKIIGTHRLFERPITELIDLLIQMGADIEKTADGIHIHGTTLSGGTLALPKLPSSQFITALMLIAPLTKQGIDIHIHAEQGSLSYIEQTAILMQKMGFEVAATPHSYSVSNKIPKRTETLIIEKDWSAASYFFSMALVAKKCAILLKGLTLSALQGDSALIQSWVEMGVFTLEVNANGILIVAANADKLPKTIDFSNQPDIALNFILAMCMHKMTFTATGLHSMNKKESPRLKILCKQLQKLNASISLENEDILTVDASECEFNPVIVNSYDDHRVAMTFAQLGLKTTVQIEKEQAVKKSFPLYWKQLKALNFDVT